MKHVIGKTNTPHVHDFSLATTPLSSKTPIAKIENNNTEDTNLPLKQEQKDAETIREKETAVPRTTVQTDASGIEERNEPASTDMDLSGLSFSADLPVAAWAGFDELSVSDHPDGIFTGSLETEVAFSQPASVSADLLDLLTATF